MVGRDPPLVALLTIGSAAARRMSGWS